MHNVKPVPEGYHTITPYLYIRGAATAIEFYQNVFGASLILRMLGPNDRIMHAEIKIGDSILMLADENVQIGATSPQSIGGVSSAFLVYVPEVDQVVEKAIAGGAKLDRPVKDQFYGDRSGTVIDPFGHKWTIATHVEDVSPEEMGRRAAATSGQAAGS